MERLTNQQAKEAAIREAILNVLNEWGKGHDMFDGYWYGYEALKDEVFELLNEEVAMKDLRSQMQSLKSEDIVEYVPTFNDEGKLCGKGYFLKEAHRPKEVLPKPIY